MSSSLSFLSAAPTPHVADLQRVETTTLLPGGSLVTVSIGAARDGYAVSDEACGRTALLALGVQDLSAWDQRRGSEIAAAQGLAFDGQGFSLSGVNGEQLTAAIVYVADACREWTRRALDARERSGERDLAALMVDRLRDALPGIQVDAERELQGRSTKKHRFDAVVVLPGERFAVFETTSPVPASIAPTHLKFFDLQQAHPDWPREAVVQDFAAWPAADLTLLQPVCTHIRAMSDAWTDLASLAA